MDVAKTQSLIESWEEPPPVRQARRTYADEAPSWADLVKILRERSGEWARLTDGLPVHTAHNITGARLAPFRPAGSFEAVSRDGRIYVRHVGAGER